MLYLCFYLQFIFRRGQRERAREGGSAQMKEGGVSSAECRKRREKEREKWGEAIVS